MQSTFIDNLADFATQAKSYVQPLVKWCGHQVTWLGNQVVNSYEASKPLVYTAIRVSVNALISLKDNAIVFINSAQKNIYEHSVVGINLVVKYSLLAKNLTFKYGTLAIENASKYGALAIENASKYGTLAKENASKYGTLAIEKVSKYGALAIENASKYGTLAKENASKYGTLAIEKVSKYGNLAIENTSKCGALVKDYAVRTAIVCKDSAIATKETATLFIKSNPWTTVVVVMTLTTLVAHRLFAEKKKPETIV